MNSQKISVNKPQLAAAIDAWLSRSHRYGIERREDDRRPITIGITAQLLDKQFDAVGEPFLVMTRDISGSGVGFLSKRKIRDSHILIRMPTADGSELDVVAKLVWQEPIGSGAFYRYGARFMVDELLPAARRQVATEDPQ